MSRIDDKKLKELLMVLVAPIGGPGSRVLAIDELMLEREELMVIAATAQEIMFDDDVEGEVERECDCTICPRHAPLADLVNAYFVAPAPATPGEKKP